MKALFRHPLFWVGTLLLVLLPLALGPFFTEERITSPTPLDKELSQLQKAAATLEKKGEKTPLTEDEAKQLLFYQTALDFSLPVFSSPFYEEAVGYYVKAVWEENQGEQELLSRILEKGSLSAFLDFLEEKEIPDTLTKEAKNRRRTLLEARLQGNGTPAEAALLYDAQRLAQALEENRDVYSSLHSKEPLTKAQKRAYTSLFRQKIHQLKSGSFSPVPANGETLKFIETLSLSALALWLLWVGRALKKEKKEGDFLKSLLPLLSGTLFALSLGIMGAVAVFAPKSLLPFYLPWGKDFFTLPFYPALLLRLVFGSLPLFFPLALETTLEKRKKGLLAPLLASLAVAGGTALFLLTRQTPTVLGSLCSLLDLREALFPTYPLNPNGVPPLLTLFFLAAAFTASLLLLLRQEKKSS